MWSQGWPAEKKIRWAFLPISDMPVQKRPSNFFETKNIFIFGACPNFGRGQKQRFTLYLGVFHGPQLGPQNTEKYRKFNDSCLRNEHTALARSWELTSRVVFGRTHPRDVKNDLGMTFPGTTRCRWRFSQKITFFRLFGSFWPVWDRQNPILQGKTLFLTTTKIWTRPKNKNIFRFKKIRGPFLNGHIR